MSRSKHTTPPTIRAARRVLAPFAPRGQGERRREWGRARRLKEHGLVAQGVVSPGIGARSTRGPRLQMQRPRPGYTYSITLAEVQHLLAFFGPRCFYGLEAIDFVRGTDAVAGATLCLGHLLVPGRILLYDHPPSPWLLPGRLAPHDEERLVRAGARLEPLGQGHHSCISWPGTTLRDFLLFDVLMHEVGHHLVQQYSGKYRARVMRTRDHEACADRYAAQCRHAYRAAEPTW